MADNKIKRISEILAFILRLMGGKAFSKTQLVKLLYLLDVVKSRQKVSNFTGIEYKSYYYGPYSDDIDKSISVLKSLGYLTVRENRANNGNSYYHFQLDGFPNFGLLKDEEKIDIEKIVSPLVNRNLNEILDIAYNTEEFKETFFGDIIQLGGKI